MSKQYRFQYRNHFLFLRYGAKYFLGVGMLVNSVFGMVVPLAARWGLVPLIIVRFIQGLGEVSQISFAERNRRNA